MTTKIKDCCSQHKGSTYQTTGGLRCSGCEYERMMVKVWGSEDWKPIADKYWKNKNAK